MVCYWQISWTYAFTTVCVRKVIYIMPEVYPSVGGFPNIERPGPKDRWY